MKIIKKYLDKGQYLPATRNKFSLWYHHTVSSSWLSSWNWWNQTKTRVGTAYLVGSKGQVVECFNPEAFAYHLGIKGDDNFHERHGVGIEVVSMGRLTKKGNKFYDAYKQIVPEVEVCKLKKLFRGNRYYQKITKAQIIAVVKLTAELLIRFPGITLPDNFDKIFDFDQSVIDYRKPGIYAHSKVRKDKDDIFPQPDFIKALNNHFIKPVKKRTVNHSNPKEKHRR